MTSLSPPVARINAPTPRDVAKLTNFALMIAMTVKVAPKNLDSDEAEAIVRRAVMDLSGMIADLGRVGK